MALRLPVAVGGAGRSYSRSEARRRFDKQKFLRLMAEVGISYSGIAQDETVDAYKDINEVIGAQQDLIDVVAVLRPRVVVMGGDIKSDDGD